MKHVTNYKGFKIIIESRGIVRIHKNDGSKRFVIKGFLNHAIDYIDNFGAKQYDLNYSLQRVSNCKD